MTAQLPKLSLRYVVRAPRKESEHPPLLLMLHGYGSNEEDLFPLADAFPPEFLVISARAPLTLSEGQYAWFHLNFAGGKVVHDEKQAETSRLVLKGFIDEVIKEFAVDASQIYLLGFSQGAIMSHSIGLTFPKLLAGYIALAGRILEEIKPAVREAGKREIPTVFVGHGTIDQTLGIAHGRSAKIFLEEMGITPEYHEYEIGHTISPTEKNDFVAWLSGVRKK